MIFFGKGQIPRGVVTTAAWGKGGVIRLRYLEVLGAEELGTK